MFLHKTDQWMKAESVQINATDQYVCLISMDMADQLSDIFGLDQRLLAECLQRRTAFFDHKDHVDYVGITFLDTAGWQGPVETACLCIGARFLIFVHDQAEKLKSLFCDAAQAIIGSQTSIGSLFLSLLEKLATGHTEQHNQIEDMIDLLENAFISAAEKKQPDDILRIRKKLTALKRYYEQLQNVMDDIQENGKINLDDDAKRRFSIFNKRIERLHQNVLILRDSVTHLRESYEAEIEIKQNNIMRLFTVVTVIFLPLTLIVGWYGMNLQMPEYSWSWSYPLVIGISLFAVVSTIILFKKHKWF